MYEKGGQEDRDFCIYAPSSVSRIFVQDATGVVQLNK